MTITLAVVGVLILGVHVLLHLVGMAVHLRWTRSSAVREDGVLLLGGRWDLDRRGARVYGALLGVAGVAFATAAVVLLSGIPWGWPLLLAAALLSLTLTALDWRRMFAGLIINVFILGVLVLGPRVAEALAA